MTPSSPQSWLIVGALIGALVRMLKSNRIPFAVPPRARPWLALGLGQLAGVVDAMARGTAWKSALLAGLLASVTAIVGHDVVIESVRGGAEIGKPDGSTATPPTIPPIIPPIVGAMILSLALAVGGVSLTACVAGRLDPRIAPTVGPMVKGACALVPSSAAITAGGSSVSGSAVCGVLAEILDGFLQAFSTKLRATAGPVSTALADVTYGGEVIAHNWPVAAADALREKLATDHAFAAKVDATLATAKASP